MLSGMTCDMVERLGTIPVNVEMLIRDVGCKPQTIYAMIKTAERAGYRFRRYSRIGKKVTTASGGVMYLICLTSESLRRAHGELKDYD